MKYTNKQYTEIFDKLPQEIKDVVASLEVSNRIWKIGENHKLHIDKIGIMHDLARDVMMGIIASRNFVKELQDGLEIPALDAASLARDIDEEIFKPIKATMIKMYGDGAPFKPSSSLVQFYEEEEEHHTIDRSQLLSEIESPAPVVVKVERVEGASKLRSEEGRKENAQTKELETMQEVEELKKMEKVVAPTSSLPSFPPLPSSAPALSMLDKIASLRLSQTTVMPRRSEEGEEVRKIGSFGEEIGEEKKIAREEGIAEDTKIGSEEAKKEIRPTSPLPSFSPSTSSAPDPYREPLA